MSKFLKVLTPIVIAFAVVFDYMAMNIAKNRPDDRVTLFFICSIITVMAVLAFFIEYEILEIRFSARRFAFAWRCFSSYYTRKEIKQNGFLNTVMNSFRNSRWFFLRSFKG
jgi:hypothetical protein